MERLTPMEEEVKRALKVLKAGGTILYPTDTIWGIGCDATNYDAVDKVYKLKRRIEKKKMIILVDTAYRIARYVEQVDELVWDLTAITETPLTIVYPGAINLPSNLINEDRTIAIRVVNDLFCRELISKFGLPIVSTSANISGEPFPETFFDIDYEILKNVDHVVDWRQSETPKSRPSKIIKILGDGKIEEIR
jgi:L-threonylcarbamoyladenylate synthase